MIDINNPGNLRPLPGGVNWYGQKGVLDSPAGAYCIFDTAEHGIRAVAKNLIAYKRDLAIDTLSKLFATWAPAGDHNDPVGYADFVGRQIGVDPYARIDLQDRAVLIGCAKAISIMENGHPPAPATQWYPDAIFEAGIDMALGLIPS